MAPPSSSTTSSTHLLFLFFFFPLFFSLTFFCKDVLASPPPPPRPQPHPQPHPNYDDAASSSSSSSDSASSAAGAGGGLGGSAGTSSSVSGSGGGGGGVGGGEGGGAGAPLELNEQAVNMNVSNLGEALFLLSSVFISAVQPQPTPRVALQLILQESIITKSKLGDFRLLFNSQKSSLWRGGGGLGGVGGVGGGVGGRGGGFRYPSSSSSLDSSSSSSSSSAAAGAGGAAGSSLEVSPVMTWVRNAALGPGDMLEALCNDTFEHNVVTVLHVNNPGVLGLGHDVSRYLTQLLQSVGLPVISWDSQFSTARQMERTLQLAPTLYHQTEAMLAFLKEFQWHAFTMVTTQVTGSDDFFAALRFQEQQSRSNSLPNKYGHVGFEFKILSEIRLRNGTDKEKIQSQLKEDIDPDTRIILLHSSSREANTILDVAEKMQLTGREYVWILTAAALGDKSAGDVASRSLPMGLFGVTYDKGVEHMAPVIQRGTRVWLQALQDMQRDGRAAGWNWQTRLSCHDGQLRKWTGGDLLFEYLRNVSLPAESSGDLPTSFNPTGMVLANRLSILNVMPKADNAPKTPKRKPSRKPGFSFGKGRGSSRGSPFGSSGRSSFGRGSIGRGSSGGGSSFGRGGSKTFPSSSSSRGSGSGGDGGSSSSGGGGDGGGGIYKSGGLGSSSRGSSSPFSSRGRGRFQSRANASSSRLFGSSSNRLSSSSRSSDSSVTSPPSSFSSGSRRLPSWRDRARSRSSRFRSRSFDSGHARDGGGGGYAAGEGSIGSSRQHLKEDSAADASLRKSRELIQDRHMRHQKARRHLLRHHRRSRSILSLSAKTFQEVATWDGKELKVVGIVWPGNSSVPPKGVPETYHLNVVTYIEEPHVTSRRLGDKGQCDIHATKCLVYERDENDNRLKGLPPIEQCCSGLSIDILSRLSKELNFNYSLFEIESSGYGSAVEHRNLSSEWTGLVGAVLKKEADVAVAALTITPEREEVIDFSIPFLETGITIVVAIREGAISPTAFLEPYDYPSWTLILVFSVHATGASIFIFEWLSPYGLDQGHTPLRVHKFSLFRSFWLIWAMLFGAAVSTDMPRGVSSRFLANIWALFAVVFLASYTANLAAFMITKEEYYDLSGIQDWRLKNPHHRHPPFKYATMPSGATETNIRKNYPELYVHMKKYPQSTVKEAVMALKDQKIQAFIYDATTLEYAVGRDTGCKLKSVGKRYAETGYGVGFPKKSPWVKKFNRVLLRMQDEGEMERLQKFWLAGACHKKRQTRGSSSHTLGILNFTSAFILLGGGVVLGTLLLMLEHVYFRFGRKSLRKWDKCGCCSLVSLSMGQSLTFEQSVMEAIDMHKHHKCKDPLCETQLWKAKHELDIAMLKIDQLKRQLAKQTAEDGTVGGAGEEGGAGPPTTEVPVWTYDPEATLQKDGVPRKRAVRSSPTPTPTATTTQPEKRKEPLPTSQRNGIEALPGATTTTTPAKPPPGERQSNGSSSQPPLPPPPPPDSPQSDGETPPRRPSLRRTRVSDGKIYENVDGGIDIESTI
ncbi:uncharacterized protein LOC143292240 [Babylonia areolata]|uniref:uncharacterized protein LOC143292240 n=1 Tax=Babylonia areolata TaxID=304850 RepID=UPI003FD1C4AF